MKKLMTLLLIVLPAYCAVKAKPAEPLPSDPISVQMGQAKPTRVRVAMGQATLIRLPDGQRVMNVYGGDSGTSGVWSIDAGKVPTRFLAVKPKATGIHTTLHVISNNGQEVSMFMQEVTGTDTEFDAEVDVTNGDGASEVKWVPAGEPVSCKQPTDQIKIISDKITKLEQMTETKAAPEQIKHDIFWSNTAKAERMGFTESWADDKFTYFKGKQVMALYEINEDGKPSLIQYKYSNGLYTVDKLLYDGYFAIGTQKRNKLVFHRDRI